jgi:hypothetical protein
MGAGHAQSRLTEVVSGCGEALATHFWKCVASASATSVDCAQTLKMRTEGIDMPTIVVYNRIVIEYYTI